MAWVVAVVDRTLSDVLDAKRQKAMARANGTRIAVDLKGCLNISDLNRIENNTEYVRSLLVAEGYTIPAQTYKKDWVYSDALNFTDTTRILNNIEALRDKVKGVVSGLPETPTELLRYEYINTAELILKMIKEHFQPSNASSQAELPEPEDVVGNSDGNILDTESDPEEWIEDIEWPEEEPEE